MPPQSRFVITNNKFVLLRRADMNVLKKIRNCSLLLIKPGKFFQQNKDIFLSEKSELFGFTKLIKPFFKQDIHFTLSAKSKWYAPKTFRLPSVCLDNALVCFNSS